MLFSKSHLFIAWDMAHQAGRHVLALWMLVTDSYVAGLREFEKESTPND
ncbi:MAG TPA: hypothetical protein VHA33_02295 [Candidatus Angelobacter sp.]|jgi:hypothetical protein|nr:hypothetical protein [Candidatus Angelobacter sp.]